MKIKLLLQIALIVLVMVSCEEPLDPIIKSVNNTTDLLQRHVWNLEEFTVKVRDKDIPPPMLFSDTDSLVRSGTYDLDNMVFDASDMRDYTVIFSPTGDMITSAGPIDALGDSIASYFVFNDRTVRISTDKTKLNYSYIYNEQNQTMALTVTSEQAGSLIRDINEKLINAIAKKTPDKLGDLVAGLLYNNQSLQRLINDVVVSALAGELEFINDFDPDEAAELLAAKIIEALKSVDWEGKLTELLKTELEKITNIDPDLVAGEIAAEVAGAINQLLSVENIYSLVLPYLNELATNPEAFAESISTLIVNEFLNVFNEDNLKVLIANAWEKFTDLDEEQVSTIADTLTSIVEEVWINEGQLSQLFLPFTQKIEETSLLQMGALAAQTTDSLEVLINKINVQFPDLNLEPDYESMEGQIKALFIVAKPAIGLAGGAEKAAADVAKLIISQFLNTENLNQVFVSAINLILELDPELAGTTIASWLVNLADDVAPEVIEYLSGLLSPILDNINPEFTAFRIATALNGFIKQNVTEESIKALIQPAIEFISNINAEAVSRFIAKLILSLDIIEDNINEENIAAILLPVLQSINETNAKDLVQSLINAVVDSGIFEDVITEDRVSAIIALLIYKDLWESAQIANNFEQVTIILRHN
jgi:hypothetical protein